jgi:hypothetical protein
LPAHEDAEAARCDLSASDETLIIRDGLHRLLPEWSERIKPFGDAVGLGREGIESTLTETGWFVIERQGSQITVQLGLRFADGETGEAAAERTRVCGRRASSTCGARGAGPRGCDRRPAPNRRPHGWRGGPWSGPSHATKVPGRARRP